MPRFLVRSKSENIRSMESDVRGAAENSCDMIVFPEMFLTGYRGENDPDEFKGMFGSLSTEYPDMLLVFGSISEDRRNRMYIYQQGREVARYDKIHLFRPNGEHEMWETGSEYVALKSGNLCIGLATCNDVRFPEQMRELKLKYNINMAIYPALWPWRRDHVLAALLKARAIENGIFVAGCCMAGIDNGSEIFDGAGNHVFDPLGEKIQETSRVYELDFSRLDEVLVDTRTEYADIENIRLFESS